MEKGKPSQFSILYNDNELFLSQEIDFGHNWLVSFIPGILADNITHGLGKWGVVGEPRKSSSDRASKVLSGLTANLIIPGL